MSSEDYNYILDCAHMRKLYNEARGYESYSLRLWNPRLNRDFRFEEGFVVTPEQLVHLDNRNGYERMDTFVERYDEYQDLHIGVVVHEAKREGTNVKKAENQAFEYAKCVIQERSLQGVYVFVTVQTAFRIWYLKAGSREKPEPLFGKKASGEKNDYLDADTAVGSREYRRFVERVKSVPTLLRAPPLPSQAALLPMVQGLSADQQLAGYDEPGSSNVSMAMQTDPSPSQSAVPQIDISDIVYVDTRASSEGRHNVIEFTYLGKTVKSRKKEWVWDSEREAMTWLSQSFEKLFVANKASQK
jgi:hypothetical protein